MSKHLVQIEVSDTVQTANGPEPRSFRVGPDLQSAMHSSHIRQPRAGETLVGQEFVDEHGNVVDANYIGYTDVSTFRQTTVMPDGDSSLRAIDKQTAYWQERLAAVSNADGSIKTDKLTGKPVDDREYYRAAGNLQMLGVQREYQQLASAEREARERAEREKIAADAALDAKLVEQHMAEQAMARRLARLGIRK